MSSSFSSIPAVNPTSTTSGKCSTRMSHTTVPISSGKNRRSSRRTYPRSSRVAMVGAYVEGRPMPYSSRAFTSVASVKRGGGWVKCCLSLVGKAPGAGGPDGLVGLLGPPLLLPVPPGLGQGVLLAEELLDHAGQLGQRRLGDVHGVGPHVGDESHLPLAGDGHAL